MLNLLTSEQTRQADNYTIKHQPVLSIDLMERASIAFVQAFVKAYPDKEKAIAVYCGTGNNGGDGLAVARLLHQQGYLIDVKIARFSGKSTADFDGNLARLIANRIPFDEIKTFAELKEETAAIIIDALLGSGLNKPLAGDWQSLVNWLNSLNKLIVSIDIPTGLRAEGAVSKQDVAIKSDLTISFQRAKINFLLPESASFIKQFEIVDIGLDEDFIQSFDSPYKLLTVNDISARLEKRKPFSHKGTYGHALIIAGEPETMGAALLCVEASLNAGSGLTTACISPEGLTALNIRCPEVMAALRVDNKLPKNLAWDKYNSLAIGPGLGTSDESKRMLEDTLANFKHPMVIDADALNMLSANAGLMSLVPKYSVLTPHVKEFDRLFGDHDSWWDRIETGLKRAKELHLVILLKNRFTMIFTPAGECIFNPTGSPAMASGGMGDVLTGIIASFLAQGYKPEDAAVLGVYLHGRTGEEIEKEEGLSVVSASRVARGIGRRF